MRSLPPRIPEAPACDWLNLVKSTQAKTKINQWFRNQFKEENIVKGKDLLQQSAKAKGIDYTAINKPEYQEKVMRKYGFHSWDDCLAAVGHGGLKEGQIIGRMYDAYRKDHPILVTDEEVLAEKQQEAAIKEKLPLPDPEAASRSRGYTTSRCGFPSAAARCRGMRLSALLPVAAGVSIHRTDCINIINLPESEKGRLIEAEWEADARDLPKDSLYRTEIHIYGNNRTGLLVDITKIFTERDIDINSINSKTSKQGIATITIIVRHPQ